MHTVVFAVLLGCQDRPPRKHFAGAKAIPLVCGVSHGTISYHWIHGLPRRVKISQHRQKQAGGKEQAKGAGRKEQAERSRRKEQAERRTQKGAGRHSVQACPSAAAKTCVLSHALFCCNSTVYKLRTSGLQGAWCVKSMMQDQPACDFHLHMLHALLHDGTFMIAHDPCCKTLDV